MAKQLETILAKRILPAVTIENPAEAIPVAQAILRGGLNVMEVPFRTGDAATCIRNIKARAPEMIVGAGTILEKAQMEDCRKAGAAFALAPGFNPSLVRFAREINLPFIPGVMTPSEVERALEMGCKLLKLFPVGPLGGPGFLKALAGPYGHLGIQFIPMGGVQQSNMNEYLQQPNVLAVGGSWLAPTHLIRDRSWQSIEIRVREAVTTTGQSGN